jgi:TatD DNase family protein
MNQFSKLIQENKLFDSHCHLNDSSYDNDRSEVVRTALNNGVEIIYDIGINLESSTKAIENAKTFPSVIASVGIDMESCIPGSDIYIESKSEIFSQFDALDGLVQSERNYVGMIGETGIDLYWLTKHPDLSREKFLDSVELQKTLFRKHIQLARKYNLPLTIHSRDAIDDCLIIIQEENYNQGVFHSLTPNSGMGETDFYNRVNLILESGLLIGVNGIITFKNAHTIRDTYMKILYEKTGKSSNFEIADWYSSGFVFETDGPYLSPEGKRGARNESRNLGVILNFFTQS